MRPTVREGVAAAGRFSAVTLLLAARDKRSGDCGYISRLQVHWNIGQALDAANGFIARNAKMRRDVASAEAADDADRTKRSARLRCHGSTMRFAGAVVETN